MTIFINAGHWYDKQTGNGDPGVMVGPHIERDLVMKIRDEIRKKLPDALYVPDDLNLRKSIDWVNERCSPDNIAVDIHLNYNKNEDVKGVECYYYKNKELAQNLSRQVSSEIGLRDRGAIPDTQTWVGSLGWVRQLKCNSVVLECGYLTNTQDLDIILKAETNKKIAQAFYDLFMYSDIEKLKKENSELQNTIDQLISFIVNTLKKVVFSK